ncbi:MAG TPA: hypothetical protein PLZ92_06605 [Phycicoccus sp.]|nr:hypothetical protein [Phycicoccus sp.]
MFGDNVIDGRWSREPDDWEPPLDYDDRWMSHGYGRDLGELTRITVFKDQVLDVQRRPVEGSGYEREAISLGAGQPVAPPRPPAPPPLPTPPLHEVRLAWLERLVGGAEALAALDDRPLVGDEGCGAEGLAWDVGTRLTRILDRIDDLAPRLIGPEGVVAARRLLVRAITNRPMLLGPLDRDAETPGLAIHAAGKANDLVGPQRFVLAKEIQSVAAMSAAPGQRSRSLADAASGQALDWPKWLQFSELPNVYVVGAPDLLISDFRRSLIKDRDECLRLRAATPKAS